MNDHPDITKVNLDGYLTESEPNLCPLCVCECEILYKDRYGEVFACDVCVEKEYV